MIVTEEEAKSKWCPFGGSTAACVGTECMMWGKISGFNVPLKYRDGEDDNADRGYCGLTTPI